MKMFALKLTVQVLLLVSLFGDLDAKLSCPCTGGTCDSNKEIQCTTDTEVCYAAEIRGKTDRIEKGCKEQDQCGNTTSCPIRTPNDVCWKYGCCNYSSCAVIYTLGEYFEVSPSSSAIKPAMVKSSPTSAIEPSSPAVKPSSPAVKLSSPTVEPSSPAVASSFVAPMTTKPEMAATTSSFQAKMTTKPMMPTTKMSEVKPMMSSQPDVKPTESKKGMMSSSEKVKPSPASSDAVRKTETLETPSPVDNRPTCGSGQVFSTVVVIAIGLFCTIF